MSGKISWDRPSGVPIETNDTPENIAYLESKGWTQIGASAAAKAPDVADARAAKVATKDAARKARKQAAEG